MELSTHTLFIGEAAAAEVIKEGEPMTYAYYHQIKGEPPRKPPQLISRRKKRWKACRNMSVQFADMSMILKREIPMAGSLPEHPSRGSPMIGYAPSVV